ncbi:unnamed protein product [Polarella glacialis]|uniref:Uncharacterized protein n=1 Tax=Polarella glacialis TaxID=89957 RepID=A0A813FY44_POLGL|nr:unnamed protein product [Polarella glacialis]
MAKALPILGNCTAGSILLLGDGISTCITGATRLLARSIDSLCGSGENTVWCRKVWHEQRFKTEPVYVDTPEGMLIGELDVDATLKKSKFPLPPDVILAKAKAVLGCEFGTKEGSDASCLADDFQFVAPIVGPLTKDEFLKAFGSFKVTVFSFILFYLFLRFFIVFFFFLFLSSTNNSNNNKMGLHKQSFCQSSDCVHTRQQTRNNHLFQQQHR